MRADLGPVVNKAQDVPSEASRAPAPEPLPSLAPAQGKPSAASWQLMLASELETYTVRISLQGGLSQQSCSLQTRLQLQLLLA